MMSGERKNTETRPPPPWWTLGGRAIAYGTWATVPGKKQRTDMPFSVGSLSLKGGGQEGVGAASPGCRSGRVHLTYTINPSRLPKLCFYATRCPAQLPVHYGWHRPPPVLPLSGRGTRPRMA